MSGNSIGGMGETQFKLMCETVGIVANPSLTDAYGWDFNVEFPCSNKHGSSFNPMLIASPIECKVQVKATRTKSKKVQVKLSNLKRMALYPLPSFFFFIEYNGTIPRVAYLLHLDRVWIKKILERVTEVTHRRKAKSGRLHKINMVVNYSDCEAIDLSEPQAIKKKIESFVSEGMESYVAQKLELLAKLGFEEGTASVSFKLGGIEAVEKLIDVSLGKENHVEVSDVIGHFKRFGIMSDVPFMEVDEGTMQILPNGKGKELSVLFKNHEYEPGVEFKAHLVNSPVNHFVPPEYIKMKVYTDFFDIFIKPYAGKVDISINCDTGQSVNILNLKKALKLWSILGSEQESVLMQFKIEGKTLHSRISPSLEVESYEELNEACEKAIQVCNELGVSLDLVNTNFSDLHYSYEDVKQMSALLFGGEFKVELGKKAATGEVISEGEVAVVFFFKFVLGDRVLGAFFSLVGQAKEVRGDRLELSTRKAVRGPIVTAMVNEKNDDSVLEELLVSFEEKLSEEVAIVVRAN